MDRRTLLQWSVGLAASLPWFGTRLRAQAPAFPAGLVGTLDALAATVLPSELGETGVKAAAAEFTKWVREYRGNVDTGHGYGVTRLQRTPASPSARYQTQLGQLDQLAKPQAASFAALPASARRAVVERVLADAKIARLPGAPGGEHVVVDLMSHFFGSSAANDLCHQAAIGRAQCRGLAGSEDAPAAVRG